MMKGREVNSSSNPFLEGIELNLSTEGLAKRLSISPLENVDLRTLSNQQRLDLLDRLPEEFFEPTSTALDIASRLYRLIRHGYHHRNPTEIETKRLTMGITRNSGKDLSKLPWHTKNAKGLTVMGITGLGKTCEVERALSLIPQWIDHGPSASAGWAKVTQVVWIKVGMSHDGSMGGLLLQILDQFDQVAGTEYSLDKSFTRLTVEKLAVHVGIIFRCHGLGALVIDEIQPRNFEGTGRGNFATTFFLRLLNFGIPIVLIGNPLGIEHLQEYSQDARRIGSGGTVDMHPLEPTDYDWKRCIVPGLLRQNLMGNVYQVDDIEELLYQYSGGIRGFAARILFCAQRLAIEMGSAALTEQHLRMAFLGADFSDKEREIINAFVTKNAALLTNYDDISWQYYDRKWRVCTKKSEAATKTEQSEPTQSTNDKKSSAVDTEVSKVKSKITRAINSQKKRESLSGSLKPEDIRANGLAGCLVRGMSDLIESGKIE